MLFDEQVVTFSEAAASLPRIRGRKVHASTVWRWHSKGLRGHKLEARRIGGRYVTSLQAVERFTKALAEQAATPKRTNALAAVQDCKPRRTEKQRRRAVERAQRSVSDAGVRKPESGKGGDR